LQELPETLEVVAARDRQAVRGDTAGEIAIPRH
jgi:hypothetical protein